ncbi:N-acetylmuramoyl-L-alanine amidase family protein [Effusibacillus consociatus]|uniref:N-acetylmuramoyl-L-alanine amidase n=1 Tax=Effusibacillus consociatus TaxID=1117041 RepID=A0ABV9Q3W0_9BACL
MKVCIDPGHGGSDPGAVGNGLRECDLTLNVALKLRDILLSDDRFQVVMTRTSDVFVDLSERARIANRENCDFFVSIHFNAFNGKAYGTEVLDYNGTGIGRVVGQTFVDILEAEEGLYDRGVKATHSTFAVIRETKCPAIITESCFIDSASDIQHFDTSEEREKLARYHYRAICAGFGMEPKQEATKPKICYYVTGGFGEGSKASQEFETFMRSKGWYYDKKY